MCPEQDSNLHVVKHTHLKRARLPIPPPGPFRLSSYALIQKMSGKRDSDPRPRPWQGRALPTELLPHFYSLAGSISLNAFAKVLILFEHPNFLYIFFQKTWRRVPAHAHHILQPVALPFRHPLQACMTGGSGTAVPPVRRPRMNCCATAYAAVPVYPPRAGRFCLHAIIRLKPSLPPHALRLPVRRPAHARMAAVARALRRPS